MTTVAATILQQLGGAWRLVMMTGAKNFVDLGNGVRFRIGRNDAQINTMAVVLTPLDTYDVEFSWTTVRGSTPKASFTNIYCDQLVDLFERTTGMYLTL